VRCPFRVKWLKNPLFTGCAGAGLYAIFSTNFITMRILLLFLLSMTLTAVHAQQEIYGLFNSPDNAAIRGSSVARGYERQVEITEIRTNAGAKSSTVKFVMRSSTATAAFRDAMQQHRSLVAGTVTVTSIKSDRRTIDYKVIMQGMKVESCSEKTVSGESVVEVTLIATRIGWMYYSNSLKGGNTISSKTGWDFSTQKEWTAF
jgi:hypothetical protein